MGPISARRRLEPYTDGRPEPLEILSRLAGNTTFRMPVGGGIPSITTEDIAHALGKVKGDCSKLIAFAIATGNKRAWPEVHRMAYPRLIAELQGDRRTRSLVRGPDKFRARLALYDAFHDLVECTEPNCKRGALHTGMTQRDYKTLYHAVAGFLKTNAVGAAHSACVRLFGKIGGN